MTGQELFARVTKQLKSCLDDRKRTMLCDIKVENLPEEEIKIVMEVFVNSTEDLEENCKDWRKISAAIAEGLFYPEGIELLRLNLRKLKRVESLPEAIALLGEPECLKAQLIFIAINYFTKMYFMNKKIEQEEE